LTFDKSGLNEALAKGIHQVREWHGRRAGEKPNHRHRRLLRAGCERRRRCAREPYDELAPCHERPFDPTLIRESTRTHPAFGKHTGELRKC
jgi:hypothetical protein